MLNNEEFFIKPSTLETIDTGFYDFIHDNLDIYTVTNNGFTKVPVLWVTPERSFQIKGENGSRDTVGRLILPVITINRGSVVKDSSFKGPIQADMRGPSQGDARAYRGGAFHVKRVFNQELTAKYQSMHVTRNLKRKQLNYPGHDRTGICFDDYFIPIPTYVNITYNITLRSEYQQQMNDMITPFITRTGQVNHFVFKKDNHKYEAFVQQDFSMNNNVTNMGEEERKFETKIDVKVLGYLIGQGVNEPRPKIIKRQSVVKLVSVEEVVGTTTSGNTDEVTGGGGGDGGGGSDGTKTFTIGNKCFIRKRITSVDEADLTAIKAKTGILDEAGEPTGEEKWQTLDGYEPGKGRLRLSALSENKELEAECNDDGTVGEAVDPNQRTKPTVLDFD